MPTSIPVVSNPSATIAPPPSASSSDNEPQIPSPFRYNFVGSSINASSSSSYSPSHYVSEQAKVGYIISMLEGKVMEWASPFWKKNPSLIHYVKAFLHTFWTVFDAHCLVAAVSFRFLQICQGNCSAKDYAIDFRTLAMEASWNNEAYVLSLIMDCLIN